MSFIRRKLRLTFALGTGAFGESGANNVTLEGHRVNSRIIKAGGNSMSTANVQIYGLPLSTVNKLATLGLKISTIRKNTVLIEAGDDTLGYSAVFEGTIFAAWGDFGSPPDVPLNVEASTGLFESVKPAPVASFKGQSDVAVLMSGFATQMGLRFRNNGVTTQLVNSYYPGSAWQQANKCANDAGILWSIDNQTLFIWPAGQPRDNGASVLISPSTGMIASPTFDAQGIRLRCVFNPGIGYGTKITVESQLDGARGDWIVYLLDYELDSDVPKGKWFMNIAAYRPGTGPVVA